MKSKPGLSWVEKLGFALLVLVVILIFNRGGGSGGGDSLIAPGTPLPELMAEGWLNATSIPTRENLAGKVVVVDCWFTDCPPCRVSMPKLAKIHRQYESLGVEFVGLTPEPAAEQEIVKKFIGTIDGFTWPVGYGAIPTLDVLGVQMFPTIVVFGKDGRAAWSSISTVGLEAALDDALAR